MTTLIKFSLKKNTGVLYNNSTNQIKKFFLNNNKKIRQLYNNEFNGLSWYRNQLLKKKYLNNYSIKKKNNYISLPVINGKKYKFWKEFITEEKKIAMILEHYKNVWPNRSLVPYHGDLTIDNIIFKKNKEVFFIDWESFENKVEWGLDICYLLISILVLPALALQKKNLLEENLFYFKKYWKNFFKNKNFNYFENPFQIILEKSKIKNNFFIQTNKVIKKQILSAIKEI